MKVPLKYRAKVIAGQSPDSAEVFDIGKVPFIQGCGEFGALNPQPVKYCDSAPKRAQFGDVLLSVRAPVGATNVALFDLGIGRGVAALRPFTTTHPRYLYWYIVSAARDLSAAATGSTFESVTATDIGSLRVPDFEVPTQERIANFLDEKTARIDALISEKERLLSRIDEYKYSYTSNVMTRGLSQSPSWKRTAYPELREIPTHWDVKRLKLIGLVRSGVTKGKDNAQRETVFLPYLRVANVQDGYVDLDEVLEIEVGKHEVDRFLLRKGDVLMNEGGDNDKLGRGTVWEGQIDPCIHQNHVFAVRLFDLQLAEWVARFTSTDAARKYFFLRSKQSTNLASINQSNVCELPVPLPPPSERQEVLAALHRVSKAVANLSAGVTEHVNRLREYRSSVITAAVTGLLDVNAFEEVA